MPKYNGIVKELKEGGGALYAVTAQSAAGAAMAQKSWNVDFPVLSDPRLFIAASLKKKGLRTPTVLQDPFCKDEGDALPGGNYEMGMYSPAALVITRDFRVIFEYVCEPSYGNMGGGTLMRSPPSEAMQAVRRYMATSEGGKTVFKEPNLTPMVPIFALLFLANGNFIRPAYMYSTPEGKMSASQMTAPLKMLAGLGAVGYAAWKVEPRYVASGAMLYSGYIYYRFSGWFRRFFTPR